MLGHPQRHDDAQRGQAAAPLSSKLIQLWLTQYDRGELQDEDGAAETLVQYEAKIAALGRKVGQLTMELDRLKRTPRLTVDSSSETSPIASTASICACGA